MALSDLDLASAEAVVEWMRRQGVTRIARAGLEIELGPKPSQVPAAVVELTDDQLIAAAKKRKDHQEAILFASSEGFPTDFEDE